MNSECIVFVPVDLATRDGRERLLRLMGERGLSKPAADENGIDERAKPRAGHRSSEYVGKGTCPHCNTTFPCRSESAIEWFESGAAHEQGKCNGCKKLGLI